MTDLDQLSAAATHDTTKEGVEREVCNPIIAYVSDGRGMSEWRLAKIIDVSRALVAEIKRLNDWADGFSDVQQKERKLAEARIAEMVTLAAHETAIEAAVLAERERCAAAVVEPIHKIVYDVWCKGDFPVTSHSHQKVSEAAQSAIRNPEATP